VRSLVFVALVAALACAAGSPAAAPTLPRVSVCGNGAAVRPSYVLLGCGDGGQYLTDVRWSTWSRTVARGAGLWWQNLCTPDCADGQFIHPHVMVTLSRPRACRPGRAILFTRLRLAVKGKRAVVARIPYAGSARCP
jgi:hypothetical protein